MVRKGRDRYGLVSLRLSSAPLLSLAPLPHQLDLDRTAAILHLLRQTATLDLANGLVGHLE